MCTCISQEMVLSQYQLVFGDSCRRRKQRQPANHGEVAAWEPSQRALFWSWDFFFFLHNHHHLLVTISSRFFCLLQRAVRKFWTIYGFSLNQGYTHAHAEWDAHHKSNRRSLPAGSYATACCWFLSSAKTYIIRNSRLTKNCWSRRIHLLVPLRLAPLL